MATMGFEGPQINLKSALNKKQEKPIGLNLAERIYRLQVIKQLIRERHMAHSAEEYNEGTVQILENVLTNLEKI